MSRSVQIFTLLELLEKRYVSKGAVIDALIDTEKQLRETWQAIAQSYAHLQIYSLK